MHENDHIQPEDLALWRQWRDQHADAATADCPSAMELAAFIDGRCTAQQQAAIESHLVACASCAMAINDVRAMAPEQGQTLVFVPHHIMEAARGLVSSTSTHPDRLRASPWRLGAGWGIAAAASLAICMGGYQLGMAAQPQPQLSEASLLTAMSFGLADEDAASDDVFVLLASANGKDQP